VPLYKLAYYAKKIDNGEGDEISASELFSMMTVVLEALNGWIIANTPRPTPLRPPEGIKYQDMMGAKDASEDLLSKLRKLI
jgi:hypothetical protein